MREYSCIKIKQFFEKNYFARIIIEDREPRRDPYRTSFGAVMVAIAVKNGTVKKTENSTVRYGTDTVTNSDPLL